MLHTSHQNGWDSVEGDPEALKSLETGKLLFMPQLKFRLSDEEQPLLSPETLKSGAKNVSYDLLTDGLKGAGVGGELLKGMLRRYALQARRLIDGLFPRYSPYLMQGRTSFRPMQAAGRALSPRKDDQRLHVDAFPSAPTQGRRLLRVFSNINPHGEERVWRVGEPFEEVARRFVPRIKRPLPGSARLLHLTGITKSRRTLYDHYMLSMHDMMKLDNSYQNTVAHETIRFPAGSSWVVQTDQISHSAHSGQYLLEQTFYLPVHAMEEPSLSPLRLLERQLQIALV